MLLDGRLPSTESIQVHLLENLFRGILEEDGAGVDRSRHLGAWTLERVEESGVDQTRLGVLEPLGDVARETKVGVLVDGARNQARYLGRPAAVGSKEEGKRIGK